MSTSRIASAGRSRRRWSRKAFSHGLVGGAAVACLVLGCAWTVYSNILSASLYPSLGRSSDVEAVAKRASRLTARSAAQAISEAFASLPAPAAKQPKSESVAPIAPSMFNERFAAAEPTGVPSRAAEASAPPAAPKLADAKTVGTPKMADAQRPKETAPRQPPTQLALNEPADLRPDNARPARESGFSLRDVADRARAAVMSIGKGERQTMVEKLWGKQPSHGTLLAYASADAGVTGSIEHDQNPANGGSPPYDLSTAVYDISAHTVYLPDGTKLEAHSGLGSDLDDPRSARIRMRGVTPPHIYELKPREALFHGVPALRLNPIGGEEAIYGRAGLLAHTFMLGPNGDSNGCVSFRDYNAFLNAYRNHGIRKLAVVARIS